MNASVAIQVLPSVEGEEVIRIVDEVIAYIKSSGLNTYVGPFETTIEGDYDQLMEIVKECQLICIRAGAPSVMSYVKINYKPDGVWTIEKKLKSITNKLYSVLGIVIILLLWQALCSFGIVADYMLPSPLAVCRAFAGSFSILMGHAKTSLVEALLGLLIGVALAFVIAVVMDRFHVIYKMTYPLLVITQAIPAVAIAPLLVLWLGYDMTPKVVLVIIVCFSPWRSGCWTGCGLRIQIRSACCARWGQTGRKSFGTSSCPARCRTFFRAENLCILLHRGGGHCGMARRQQRARRVYDPCAQILRV